MIRLYLIPFSTNVERVALALAHKGLEAEVVELDPADRSRVVEVSGQELVPVIEHDGRVIADSPAILEYLEEIQPHPPLYPADGARRAELELFVDWFNRVWKVAPNAIEDGLVGGSPDRARIDVLAADMARAIDWFEALLEGRSFLFGDAVSAADFVAFPFVKYALLPADPTDEEVFHHVLSDYQALGDDHPRLAEWIRRVDALPRVPAV